MSTPVVDSCCFLIASEIFNISLQAGVDHHLLHLLHQQTSSWKCNWPVGQGPAGDVDRDVGGSVGVDLEDERLAGVEKVAGRRVLVDVNVLLAQAEREYEQDREELISWNINFCYLRFTVFYCAIPVLIFVYFRFFQAIRTK